MENMAKGKHFELTTLSSHGNCQVPRNAPFSKPIGLTFAELSGQVFHNKNLVLSNELIKVELPP